MGIFKLLFFTGIVTGLILLILTITSKMFFVKSSSSTLGTNNQSYTSSVSANLTLEPPDNLLVTPVVILEVLDINTLRVLLNDGMQTVDLIGVKVPTDASQKRYEKCYGETIEMTIQDMALGKKAFMIDDKFFSDSDDYKYIFLEDMTFLNLELIKKGLTNANITSSYMYVDEFSNARMLAEEQSIGVWHDTCKVTFTEKLSRADTKPTPTPTNPPYLYAKLLTSATPTKEPSPAGQSPLGGTTPTHQPQQTQLGTQTSKPSSLNPEILFTLINNHRQSIGKNAFEKDGRLCSLAVERGPELYDEIFVTHNVHAGLTNRNLPYWITENMAHYDSEEQVFNWWMGSTIHRRAIESDNKYSCGECYGNSCAQLFTSWSPK